MKKLIKKINVDIYLIFLSIISLLFFASLVRYGLRTYQVPVWDEQHYMRMATEFYRLLQKPSLHTPYDMLQVVPFRQPGYPLLIVPFYFLFGLSHAYFWGQFTNGILYIATIFSIYFLARLYISKLASFLASFIFTFYGWTLLHVHLTYSETAVSAFSILAILFVMKSNFFRDRKKSILFGIFFGLALTMKWLSLVFVFGALLWIAYSLVVKKLLFNKSVVVNASIAFFIALLIMIYPYYTNFYWFFSNWYTHRQGGPISQIIPVQESNPFSAYSLTFYINSFAQLGLIYFILFLIGFFLAFKKTSTVKPILCVFITVYCFYVYAVLKAERHIVPIYPYVAIISASVFDYLKNSLGKIILFISILILSVFSFLGSDWGKGPMKQSLYSLPISLPFGQMKKIYLTTISRPPYIYKISGNEILEFLSEDSKKNRINNPQILSLFYYRPLDEPLMAYNMYYQKSPFQITNYLGTVISDPEKESEGLLQNVFNNYDYILMKTGQTTDNYFPKQNYLTLKALIILFEKDVPLHTYFEEKTRIWINQDSSIVTIYKKKKNLSREELEKMRIQFIDILESLAK